MNAKQRRGRRETYFWYRQPVCLEGPSHAQMHPGLRPSKDPLRFGKVPHGNIAPARPGIARVSYQYKWIAEQNLNVQVLLVCHWTGYAREDKIVAPFMQARKFGARRGNFVEMEGHARLGPAETFDGRGQD